ncbi:hypothetical protein GCM10022243_09240 [Saccharothrix violaceirubra]|uniref:DNA-binding CsgD family transcriptional regulator n=1 Tax=Saccharothrix violaceirubra TaxID=413306 RepID=A0A7W7T446_9PSEU|nr:LuxR C-terminal-related transcriptional regulator [Saccharothrix violaceirubra]MBB4966239.1 DNA-binding CsgD family transcriptional regulator [Saccharothrix violaceirubra]
MDTLRHNRLVDRETHLARIAELAAYARAGSGGLLRLVGGSGVGRSALLAEAARRAALGGLTVLRARCAVDETATSYAAARQLFGLDPNGDGTEAELWSLLRLHCAHDTLLLAVDDVGLADPESQRWLVRVARRVDRLPVLLLVTERREPGLGQTPSAFARDLPVELAATCRVAPLDRRAAATLAPLADACFPATAGNPALLTALLADLEPGAAELPTVPGETFTDAVGRWLRGCGARAETAAGIVALLQDRPVADPDDPAALIAAYCAADVDHVTGWFADLAARGLLVHDRPGHWPRFAHPLLTRAVLAGLAPGQRAEIHRAAARFRHRNGEPDDRVAAHLLHTAAPGPAWAAHTLVSAARTASPADAVVLLRRALDEPLGEHRRGLVLGELGGLEVVTDDAERGIRHLVEAVHLQQSVDGLFRAANTLGTVLAARGETPAALDVMADLAERFADRPDLVHAVEAAAALIASHDGRSWLEVVRGLRRIAVGTPHDLAPPAFALLTEFDATNGVLSAAEVADRVHALVAGPLDPAVRPYVLVSAATLAQWADLLGDAERLVERGLAAFREPTLEPAYQCLLSVRAETRIMRGEYAELLAESSGRNPHLVAQTVIALIETGRPERAHELVAGVDDDRDSWEWNEFLYARGLLRLASGSPAEALADLRECGRRQAEREVHSPVVTPWRSAAAECHVLLGEPGPAVALAEEELRLARIWGTPRAVGRALRALASATGGRRGLSLAADAVDLLREPAVPELVPALITHGRLLADNGRRITARRVLRDAATRAGRAGAVRLRGVAEAALRDLGARGARPETLTDSEERICRLAAAGHSNTEIAELLHLAVRTVETHLTNSYRKLGVRRRSGLAAALG